MLWTNSRAIHDRVTTIQLERVVQFRQPLVREVVAGVLDPAVRLHQHRRAQVFIGVPPVGGARGATARAQDALVHAIEFGAVLAGLQKFSLSFLLAIFGLKPGLNGPVLFVD